MLPPNQSHLAYTLILFQHIRQNDRIAKVISRIDLSCVYDLCKDFYSSNPWERVADHLPQDALRSLLVMYLAGFTSINKWVKELKDTPRYAYLSGFSPEKTPSKAYFSWFTSNLFGKDVDIDDIMTQRTLLKKIFETIFVKKSVELGIIDPHDKVIFDGCKAKSFCKQKYQPDKSCRCSSNGIKPFNCSMCTDSEATRGYDHNLDKYLMGYGLHFAATPLVDNPSKCLPLTFFVTGADVHDSRVAPHLLMYLYHDMKVDFNYVILDSGYDAFYIYWWICLLGGKPIIAINPRNSQTPTSENEYGLPVVLQVMFTITRELIGKNVDINGDVQLKLLKNWLKSLNVISLVVNPAMARQSILTSKMMSAGLRKSQEAPTLERPILQESPNRVSYWRHGSQ